MRQGYLVVTLLAAVLHTACTDSIDGIFRRPNPTSDVTPTPTQPLPVPKTEREGDGNGKASESTKTGVLTASQVRQVLVDAGFKEGELSKMSCIAFCESGFNAAASNDNGPPDDAARYDRGLFQINGANLTGCNATASSMFDPVANAKCARRVYLSQGYGAWAVYKPYCQNPPSEPTQASCK